MPAPYAERRIQNEPGTHARKTLGLWKMSYQNTDEEILARRPPALALLANVGPRPNGYRGKLNQRQGRELARSLTFNPRRNVRNALTG